MVDGRQGPTCRPVTTSILIAVYTSSAHAQLCTDLGVPQSMGAVGTSADNSLAESINATLKREILQDHQCRPDDAVCRRQLFRWILRYNNRRRHSHCQQQSPTTYETTATLPLTA